MGSRVTIMDVARAAGVSRSSVSNFLTGHLDHLGSNAQERIRASISQLGYEPNAAARTLKSGTLPTIGLLLPSIANPFYCEIAQAIEAAALTHAIRVMVCSTFRDVERERSFLHAMSGYGIAGVIKVSALSEPGRTERLGRPCVAIDAPPGSADLVVNIDNASALSIAVEHLASLGHRCIAYAGDNDFTHARSTRDRGFRDACQQFGMSGKVLELEPGLGENTTPELELFDRGLRYANAALGHPSAPTATICLNDLLAAGVLHGLRATGVDVPAKHSVVGIDDVLLARVTQPALTTIQQPIGDMGGIAVAGLAALIRGESVEHDVTLQATLVARGSTGPIMGR